MRHALRTFLVVGCAALTLLSMAAGAAVRPAGKHPSQTDSLAQYRSEATAALKRGAYREALQSLEVILAIAPDDPWAQLYHDLCERRLQTPQPFQSLSPDQLASLKDRLRREAKSQRQADAQRKALERQVHQEQAKWDRELDAITRQTEQERRRTRTAAQAQAVSQRQPSSESRQAAPPETPSAQPTAPTTPSRERVAEPTPAPAPTTASTESVELSPVRVTTAGGKEMTPDLVGRPLPPPGAVQINARQMSMSPDRKIAFAEGDVEIISGDAVMTADRVTLFTDTNDVYADGRVRLAQGTTIFHGEMVHYNFNTKKGRFLQGAVSAPPWHEYGRSVEHIAEGVYEVTPGYITSCDHDPPHFKFLGKRAVVFADDKSARIRNVALVVERVPFLYFPWLYVADRQSPFFIIPGKRKPWGAFALMGYRYQFDTSDIHHSGTLRLDWRRQFRWGEGIDHQFESPRLGKGLVKLYYNSEMNHTRRVSDLPKGAKFDRHRVTLRYLTHPLPDTTVLADLEKFSDEDFRKEFLFREEFTQDDVSDSFISWVTNTPNYSLSALVRKRMNRFQTVDEALPQVTFDVPSQPLGGTNVFSETKLDVANLQTKRAHTDNDTDAVRVDWFQQFKYGMSLFQPILVTPRMGVRQTFYNKDIQGGPERPQGKRNLISGQFSMGADASLKLFQVFPVMTNVLGLDINALRHVLSPSISYTYSHPPTVPSSLLNFPAAGGASNEISFSLENKLQTKRLRPEPVGTPGKKKPRGKPEFRSVDLARWAISIPYTFAGNGNKQGGRLGNWFFDLETYPWPWVRLESDWTLPSHFNKITQDSRVATWNLDLVMIGGRGELNAQQAPKIQSTEVQAPTLRAFEPGPKGNVVELLMPRGQWYVGLGHRYSRNDKTESILEWNWRPTEKWEIGTFHRFTWKEVAGGSKRFNNLREWQYSLRRDLHDWIAEVVYRVDREFGEELFFTLTLKAYPNIPIEMEDSYHQPKFGSQSSPFSPISGQRVP